MPRDRTWMSVIRSRSTRSAFSRAEELARRSPSPANALYVSRDPAWDPWLPGRLCPLPACGARKPGPTRDYAGAIPTTRRKEGRYHGRRQWKRVDIRSYRLQCAKPARYRLIQGASAVRVTKVSSVEVDSGLVGRYTSRIERPPPQRRQPKTAGGYLGRHASQQPTAGDQDQNPMGKVQAS